MFRLVWKVWLNQKTLKEESTNKNNFDDNYNLVYSDTNILKFSTIWFCSIHWFGAVIWNGAPLIQDIERRNQLIKKSLQR